MFAMADHRYPPEASSDRSSGAESASVSAIARIQRFLGFGSSNDSDRGNYDRGNGARSENHSTSEPINIHDCNYNTPRPVVTPEIQQQVQHLLAIQEATSSPGEDGSHRNLTATLSPLVRRDMIAAELAFQMAMRNAASSNASAQDSVSTITHLRPNDRTEDDMFDDCQTFGDSHTTPVSDPIEGSSSEVIISIDEPPEGIIPKERVYPKMPMVRAEIVPGQPKRLFQVQIENYPHPCLRGHTGPDDAKIGSPKRCCAVKRGWRQDICRSRGAAFCLTADFKEHTGIEHEFKGFDDCAAAVKWLGSNPDVDHIPRGDFPAPPKTEARFASIVASLPDGAGRDLHECCGVPEEEIIDVAVKNDPTPVDDAEMKELHQAKALSDEEKHELQLTVLPPARARERGRSRNNPIAERQ